ncbi:MAG TPA: serine protease [Urbifossiella sp.]|jgi:S1-C subfamily serine protease|nr:serine protease [Urbifossiella sp.]
MPVVHCPTCRQALSVADGLGGAVVTCPACQQPMTLPADPPAAVAAPPAVVAAPDFIEPFATTDREPPRSRTRDQYRGRDREPEPVPAGRERKTDWTPVALVGAAGFFGLIGVVVVVWMLAANAKTAGTGNEKAPEPVAKADRPAPAPKTPTAAGQPVAKSGVMDDATVARIKKATVYIRITSGKQVSSGSGFFVDKGMVVTNNHVVYPPGKTAATKIEVVVQSGTTMAQTFPAKLVGNDAGKDLALLEVEGAFAPNPLTVSESSNLRETHDVYAFGFPLGENLGEEITVVKTTVSSLRRNQVEQIIQLNGGLHPGNSGGPVTDSTGRVVGVAVAVIRGTQIHFAIAGEEVQTFLSRYLKR